MKVALLLSGQPRFVQRGFEHLKPNLIDCNESVDVFCHHWQHQAGQSFDASPWNDGRMETVTTDVGLLVEQLYAPRVLCWEKPRTFQASRDYSSRIARTPVNIMFSMNYSRQRAWNLFSPYAEEYDWVIVTRTDWGLLEAVKLSDYDPAAVNVHGDVHNDRMPAYNDGFIFSSPANMQKVLSLYDHLDSLWLSHPAIDFAQEALLAAHLIDLGLTVRSHSIKYGILRLTGADYGG